MATTLTPYLNFDGRTEEAMRFYAECLGGALEIMKMSDAPMPQPVPDALKNRVLHAMLKTDGITIMASDGRVDQPPVMGDSVNLNLTFTDKTEQQRIFDKLAVGATILQPLGDAFFGRFGMLKDRFGMNWMFVCQG
jgi:PhnB protein